MHRIFLRSVRHTFSHIFYTLSSIYGCKRAVDIYSASKCKQLPMPWQNKNRYIWTNYHCLLETDNIFEQLTRSAPIHTATYKIFIQQRLLRDAFLKRREACFVFAKQVMADIDRIYLL